MSHKTFTALIVFCAGLGGILYGYDIGVISGALLFIQKSIPMTDGQIGFIVGAVLTGGLAGTLIAGPLADKFGRRTMIIGACLLFILGILFILFSGSFVTLLIARLLLGIAVGMVAVAVPLYITEIAPANIRGRGMTLFQLLLTFGILLAYFVDLLFVPTGNWRGMFSVILIPTGILLISMMFLPETPRWLLSKNRKDAAEKVLFRTRSIEEAKRELMEITANLQVTDGSWRALFVRSLWLPLAVALLIAICNQLTGINVLLQYAPLVIERAGLNSQIGTMLGTIGIGFINFLGTVFAFFLIDKFGRKKLLIAGTVGIIVAYACLGVISNVLAVGQMQAELSLIGFFVFILCYAIGPGVVVWLAISELLPTKVRGKAVAVCLFANSLAASVLSTVFLLIEKNLGVSGTYFLLAGFTVIYFLVALFLLPETKGKTLEEIHKNYVDVEEEEFVLAEE